MKKVFIALALFLTNCLALQAEPAFIPYHEQASYFLYSPGSLHNDLLGHFNSATLAAVTGGEFLVNGTVDLSTASDWTQVNDYQYLGLFAAAPGLGFSLVKPPVTATTAPVYYKLASGFGDKTFSLGLGFGWNNNSTGLCDLNNNFSAGLLVRPFPFLSWGLFGTWAFSGQEGELVADLAIRPFENNLLTVFGDYTFGTPYYGLGLAAEVARGIVIGARFEPALPAFALGLRISFGRTALASQLHTQLSSPGFQKPLLSLAARVGADEPSIIQDAANYQQQYLWLNLKGEIINKPGNNFFQQGTSLLEVLKLLDKTKTDTSIAAVVINTSGLRADITSLWELREKIKDLKLSGKKIAVFIDNADINLYHFASLADQIIMDPMGNISLPGYISGNTFYKGLLDKLGLGVEELRYYEFKSAAESLTRKDFSESDRKQRQLLINDRYELARNEICQARSFSADDFDALVNQQYYLNAKKALEHKLVDKIVARNDLDTFLHEWLKAEKERVTPQDVNNRPAADYDRWSEPPAIALVYAEGMCAMDTGIRARELAPLIESLGDNPAIVAIVLRVNSPGGDSLASEFVAQAIKKVTKPVIISQGAVAASGGYWISMNGDYIFSTPDTITGSIGVIFSYLYNQGFKEALGLTTDTVQRGEHADLFFGMTIPFAGLMLPNRPLNATEKELFAANLKDMYETFVTNVATARHKSFEEIDAVARGHVWSGQSALGKGLVDELGGLEQAIHFAKSKAKIPESTPIKIIEYPKESIFAIDNLLEQLAISLPVLNIPGANYLKYKQQRITEILMTKLQQRLDFNGLPIPLLPWDEWELSISYEQ